MLGIDIEAFRGILFVRLKGDFNKDTINKFNCEVTEFVKSSIVRNIVFNFSELNSIDSSGIFGILNNYYWCKNNDGLSLICSASDKIKYKLKNSDISKYMYLAKDELDAVRIFNI